LACSDYSGTSPINASYQFTAPGTTNGSYTLDFETKCCGGADQFYRQWNNKIRSKFHLQAQLFLACQTGQTVTSINQTESNTSNFSLASREAYRLSFTAIGNTAISSVMDKTLTSAVITGDSAQYYFEDIIAGETITFPVELVKENGVWKILDF